jgi:apolipoprotein N-acyltransferase
MKLRALKSAVALASGVLLFLSCADFDIWPLTWFAMVPMLWVVLDARTEKPWAYGLLCGLTANGGGFYWIVGFLQRFGHLPLVAALPIFSLLIAYQAITFAVFAWALRRLRDHLNVGVTFLAPLVYVAVELVVPYVFPWYLAITQAWVRPVIQAAELTGPLGVSFLLVLSNAALYELAFALRRKRPLPWRRLVPAAVLLVGNLVYGQVRIHQVEASRAAAPKLKVGIVQANIGIHEKWRQDLAESQLAQHQLLSAELEKKGADLIVWPESSYPFLFRRDQATDWPVRDLRRAQRGFTAPLLFGTLTVGNERYPFNSALLLDREGNVRGSFDKNILMVFGEYIPFYEQMKWIHKLIPETSNWGRGTDVAVFPLELPSGTAYLGPMICYEDIFPSFGRRLAKRGPNLLVNITNDAWFGRTSEPYEHLALSVYRAVETRVDLVRAVNTGVSAFVDSTGRVVDQGPAVDPDEKPEPPFIMLAEARVQKPQLLYATLGEWFGGLCLALVVVAGVRARARAGCAVRWRLVGIGVVGLGLGIVPVAALSGHLGLALSLLAHRNIPEGLADVAFSTGLWLVPAVALGCALCGIAVTRAGGPAPLEAACAVLLVLVVPALLLGTLEGEQAGLVISAMLAMALAAGAGRLYRRLRARPTSPA